jgi:threonyl-tRNA synthetase
MFVAVLGAKEMEDRTVSIRTRDSKSAPTVLALDEAIKAFSALRQSKGLTNEFMKQE